MINLAAIPFSYWLITECFADFEVKIHLGALNFILPIIGLTAITLLTIYHNLIELKKTNLIKSLVISKSLS